MNKHRLKRSNRYRFEESIRPRYRKEYKRSFRLITTIAGVGMVLSFITAYRKQKEKKVSILQAATEVGKNYFAADRKMRGKYKARSTKNG